ncbi:MAG TPA: response regulator transcription factor [Burkholderiaceae bacterium]|nr:response regulator transcription factor [Burkholderiaceae bacterium]
MLFTSSAGIDHNAHSRAIRVFVAEDHQITLWGLQRLISSASMEVVGTASSHTELMNHDAAAAADVILLDLDLGGEDTSASLASLRQRCPGRVLVLTAADDLAQHRAAVLKGARGVVHKSAPADTILRAIQKVNDGEVWLQGALLGDVLSALTDGGPAAVASCKSDPDAQRIASLTPREREIVVTMVRSAGAKQLSVADELGMSEHTLRNHLTTIYSKLCVRGRLELHVYATAHGLGAATRPRLDA